MNYEWWDGFDEGETVGRFRGFEDSGGWSGFRAWDKGERTMCWKRENGVEKERGEDEVGMAKQGSGFWVDIGEREDEEERERACDGEGGLSGTGSREPVC